MRLVRLRRILRRFAVVSFPQKDEHFHFTESFLWKEKNNEKEIQMFCTFLRWVGQYARCASHE